MAAPRSMRRRRATVFAIISLLVFGPGCRKGTPAAPSPTPIPTPSPTPSTGWTTEGTRLQGSDFGTAAGSGGVADPSAVTLPDGRIRLYVGRVPPPSTGILSAVSNDGLSFTAEAGERVSSASFPRVVPLDGGGWRLFFQAIETGIGSAVSTDGVTFTREAGLRIRASDVGATNITGPGIYRPPQGGYRMYFSESPGPGGASNKHVYSATSPDLLNWTVESGVRVGPGSTLSGSAEHPFPLSNPDGSVTLFYARFPEPHLAVGEGLWMSTSANGLDFVTEEYTGINGNDPDVLRLSDGTLRMYYGGFSESTGGFVQSARRAATLTPSINRLMISPPWVIPDLPAELPTVPRWQGDQDAPSGERRRRPLER